MYKLDIAAISEPILQTGQERLTIVLSKGGFAYETGERHPPTSHPLWAENIVYPPFHYTMN